jgi:sugar/nucleoside kinase (ribokinase family)
LYMAHYLQAKHQETPTVVSTYGPDMQPYLGGINILPAKPDQSETLVYENDTRSLPRIWKAHKTEHAGEPELTSEVVEALRRADVIMVAPLLPNYPADYLRRLLREADPGALKVLCPQGYFREISQGGLIKWREFVEATEVVPFFDLVVYSEEDHPRALEVAKSWEQVAPDTHIVVTQGPNGATVVTRDKQTAVPTTPLPADKIVDSVGCGDVFAITTTYYYRLQKDLQQAVDKAHQAAAEKLLTAPLRKS